jgi:hypothetical protein
MHRFPLPLPLLLALLLFQSACGYHVLGNEPVSAAGKPTLAIPLFVNRSTEVGLEALFANDLIRAIGQSKIVQVRAGDKAADLVLTGTLQRAEKSSVAFYDINRSLIRRETFTVDLVLKDYRPGGQGKVIWKETQLIKADYFVDPNYHIGEADRDMAIRRAASHLAQRVLDKISMLF